MRVAVFAKIFPGTDPNVVLPTARDAGFIGVQYNMSCSGLPSLPESIPNSVAEAVARAASDAEITIEAVSATYNMIHPDPSVRRRGLQSLAVIAAQAHTMGTGLVTLCTGTRDPIDQWRYHPENQSAEAWRDLVAACHAALRIAETHDVDLGIEPEPANVVSSADAARRLIDIVDDRRLKVILDPANLVEGVPAERRQEVIEAAVALLADRIALAHAKDRTADGRVIATGRGVVDFDHFVGCLRRAGYDGPLVAHGFTAEEAAAVARRLSAIVSDIRQ